MKKLLVIRVIFLFGLGMGQIFSQSFSVGLGVDSLNYSKNYLTTSMTYQSGITDSVELALGASFGIRVEDQAPTFWLPAQVGLGFLFQDILGGEGVIGVGLSPGFNWGAGLDGLNFYLGPYIQLGLRLQIHPYMRWYFDVQQDLHIGRPEWIGTSTRLITGINFFFDREDDPR